MRAHRYHMYNDSPLFLEAGSSASPAFTSDQSYMRKACKIVNFYTSYDNHRWQSDGTIKLRCTHKVAVSFKFQLCMKLRIVSAVTRL